jgi:hypothetical protein
MAICKDCKGSTPHKKREICQSCYDLKRRYGITFAQKQALLEYQGNKCAICKTLEGPFFPDHIHGTKIIRFEYVVKTSKRGKKRFYMAPWHPAPILEK